MRSKGDGEGISDGALLTKKMKFEFCSWSHQLQQDFTVAFSLGYKSGRKDVLLITVFFQPQMI